MPAKLSNICRIKGWSKQRIEKWISDGYFRPIDTPETGKMRDWSLQDLMRLICFIRLVEMGASSDAGKALPRMFGHKHEGTWLVVQVLDRDLVKGTSTVDLGDVGSELAKIISERGDAKRHRANWCKAEDLASYASGMGAIGIFVLPLDEIERDAERLLKRAERLADRSSD